MKKNLGFIIEIDGNPLKDEEIVHHFCFFFKYICEVVRCLMIRVLTNLNLTLKSHLSFIRSLMSDLGVS